MPSMPEPTRLFEARIRDCLTAPAATLGEEATLQEAWEAARNGRGPFVVLGKEGRLAGAFSPSDVLDWLARGIKPGERIAALLPGRRAPLDADTRLLDAVVALERARVSALPVTDRGDRFLGVVSLCDILQSGATPAFSLAAMLAADDSIDGLRRAFAKLPDVTADLLAAGTPEEQILALLSDVNGELHRRALALVVEDLAADGWGAPPVEFALVVMGSGGRRENLLLPDQDNGLILADHVEAQRPAVESYFISLAERLTATLAAIGFALCKGNVMATNPVWRKPITEWRQQIDVWTQRRQPLHLLNSDVLLDVAHVAGAERLTIALRRHMLDAMSATPQFVRDLYRIEEDHGVALNWLGLLKREVSESEEPGVINLKMRGTLPLVEGARLLSVLTRIPATSTTARLEALADAGKLDKDEATTLIDCFRAIAGMILTQQVADARAGRPITDYVVHEALAGRDKTRLRRALREIETFRADLPSRLGL